MADEAYLVSDPTRREIERVIRERPADGAGPVLANPLPLPLLKVIAGAATAYGNLARVETFDDTTGAYADVSATSVRVVNHNSYNFGGTAPSYATGIYTVGRFLGYNPSGEACYEGGWGPAAYNAPGVIGWGAFGDQYIGGGDDGLSRGLGGWQSPYVKQLTYLSLSGSPNSAQGFDASEVILSASRFVNGLGRSGDWSGLHVRSGDRVSGPYTSVTALGVNLADSTGGSTSYGRIQYMPNGANAGAAEPSLVFGVSATGADDWIAAMGINRGSGAIFGSFPTGGASGGELWVRGLIGCLSGYTVWDAGSGTVKQGQSGTVMGIQFLGGLKVGGSASVSVAEGGTGNTALTSGQLLMGNGTGAVQMVDTLLGGTF
jgi:hypothetical protein